MKKIIARITTLFVAAVMMMLSCITASAETIRVAGGLYDTDSFKGETKFLVDDCCCVRAGYWNIYPKPQFSLTAYDQKLTALYPFTVKEVCGKGWYKIYFGPVETDEAYIYVSEVCCNEFFYVLSRETKNEETTTSITTVQTTTQQISTTQTTVVTNARPANNISNSIKVGDKLKFTGVAWWLRSKKSLFFSQIGFLVRNSEIEIQEIYNDCWYKVSYRGQSYFMRLPEKDMNRFEMA